ncbi:hypothetical protein C7B67_20910 [filamentous cyanobacterium Phorm 6]|nr:hypothetical protein C7B67_20910 [filamentous cyanobacterium Phorm 6]
MSTNYVEEASLVEEEGILTFADEEQISGLEKPITGVGEETVASSQKASAVVDEKVAVGYVETDYHHLAPKAIAKDEKAIVEEEIRPGESGRVRFQSSWWPATSDQEITCERT